VRIIFLLVFLLLGGNLLAEDASHQKQDTDVQSDKKAITALSATNNFTNSQAEKKIEGSGFLVKKTPESKPSVSNLSNWPIVLLMLLGIVCLILCLAWFAKRYGGFNMAGARDIRVLSSASLGARERVALIDVKGQQFLVGVTTQNINHLHTFDEQVIEADMSKTKSQYAPKNDFAEKLQSLLKVAKSSSNDSA